MISDNYTIGYLQSNGKRSKPKLVFGNKPQDIEGYTEAINSDELYVPHHRLEKVYTSKELMEMGRYDNVPAEELIWLPISKHHGNRETHKGFENCGGGNIKGHTPQYKPETIERIKFRRLEAQIEKLNNEREKRLRNIRFELIIARTDISRQRKSQIIKNILIRKERKLLKEFNKLLNYQQKLKAGGKSWIKYEEKLQSLIEKL